MSFENRFIILPDGLVSKNRIDAKISPLNMPLCKFCEARTASSKNPIDLENARKKNWIIKGMKAIVK